MKKRTPHRGTLWLAALVLFAAVAAPLLHRGWTVLGTDFPNYYLLAHLRAEGTTVDRAYEWIWLQRQKDRIGLAQPLVGLGQITPFSAAVLWPLAKLSAATAKHRWMLVNVGLLLGAVLLLQRLTKARMEAVLLLAACCVPLWRNFEYGQFYLLLLVLVLCALYLERRGKREYAGFLIGLAAALKVFPLLLLLPSLARGKLRTAAGTLLGLLFAAAVSIRLFGMELCLRYATEVLLRGLRGDVADPYSLGNGSLGAALRRLFVFDPGLNPHPLANLPALANIVGLAVSLLLIGFAWQAAAAEAGEEAAGWSMVVLASLLISSAPASYQFVLLLLPVCVLIQRYGGRLNRQCFAIGAYLVAVAPWPAMLMRHAWFAWLLPRWCATLALFVMLSLEMRGRKQRQPWTGKQRMAAVAGLTCATCLIVTELRSRKAEAQLHFVGKPGLLFEGRPQWPANELLDVRLDLNRYAVSSETKGNSDELFVAAAGDVRWVEHEESGPMLHESGGQRIEGEMPALSPLGTEFVFLREVQGRGVLYSAGGDGSGVRQHTGADFDVYEAAVTDSNGIYIAAKRSGEAGPHIYRLGRDGKDASLLVKERSRYPAASPDGTMLAYSEEVHGSWQLRLLDLRTGTVQRLSTASCNVTEPAWKSPSEKGPRTVLVSSDCGRGLGMTGIFEIRLP